MNGIPIWILPFLLIVSTIAAIWVVALIGTLFLGILSPFIIAFCWLVVKIGDAIDRRWGRWQT